MTAALAHTQAMPSGGLSPAFERRLRADGRSRPSDTFQVRGQVNEYLGELVEASESRRGVDRFSILVVATAATGKEGHGKHAHRRGQGRTPSVVALLVADDFGRV